MVLELHLYSRNNRLRNNLDVVGIHDRMKGNNRVSEVWGKRLITKVSWGQFLEASGI